MASVGNLGLVEEEEDESGCLEPFFYDEAEVVAQAAVAEERQRRELAEKASKEAKARQSSDERCAILESIYEYDERKGHRVFTRFFLKQLGNLDEESLVRRMRHTNSMYTPAIMCNSANILSVKIVSSDVGFPLNVYGSIIARDNLDRKCIYIFRRDEDNCQFIKSEDESLILTGPSRGLVLIDDICFEVNLKVKGIHRQSERQLSKGLLGIDGRRVDENGINEVALESRLSIVEMKYAAVTEAIEATVEFEILQRDFTGEITAHTTSMEDRIVLHDTKLGGLVTRGIIELRRPVMAVSLDEMLILTIVNESEERTIEFTAWPRGGDRNTIYCGGAKLLLKVTWSIIDEHA